MNTVGSQHSQLPLRNAEAIFLAHFHIRRGNELVWQKGDADLAGVEWKVLPSGSHGVERDIIYFEAHTKPDGNHRIGLAAFRNTKLSSGNRSGVVENDGEDDQRGARMLAVGAILECGQSGTPRSILDATLPHIFRLEGLVDALSANPSCRDLLEEWLEEHKTEHKTISNSATHSSPLYAQDPLYQLPAITNALGPLLPSLLKRLILPRFRLLLYIPGGAPTFRAADIAFALGELAYSACQSDQQSYQECPVDGPSMKQHGLKIIGLIGLYDIARLQDEAERLESCTSWIAWTTDRIFLEKCEMYDAVLDLSPMTSVDAYFTEDFLATPTALPRLMSSHRIVSNTGRRSASLRKQNWTAREFTVFRGIDEQASLAASRRAKRRANQGNAENRSGIDDNQVAAPQSPYLSPTRQLSQQGRTSTFLALLRFWLANLWILPYHWRFNLRESYGYVPLSIRSDGGVRASIMLLPDDESDISDDDSVQEEEQQTAGPSSSHLSAPSAHLRRRSSSTDGGALSDEDDDPILAACGATQASNRQRKSRSHSSISKSAIPTTAAVDELVDGGNDEEVENCNSMAQEARESVELAQCIFEYWSLWVRELVQGGQQLVQDKLARERDEVSDENALLQGNNKKEITISAGEMAELQLSASNAVDVDLIVYLASTVSRRPVIIQRTWWSAAAALWS